MKKRYHNSRPRTPDVCPVCGEDVPPEAAACRGCGADHSTGWNLAASDYDGLDLPDAEFDYDEFMHREFGQRPKWNFGGLKPLWWLTALVLLIAMALALFR
ncbi:hypothetical protein [Verrucomicrobium sp. BvORR106]|uniref:hypothetical protein n=1 Tax=Verrucomicrobium sp. BvORR106 TaxID=1403819 RepID=UPI002240FAFA|nr:hypothetical protein [Verrucomicrobium sp. BvORR106]